MYYVCRYVYYVISSLSSLWRRAATWPTWFLAWVGVNCHSRSEHSLSSPTFTDRDLVSCSPHLLLVLTIKYVSPVLVCVSVCEVLFLRICRSRYEGGIFLCLYFFSEGRRRWKRRVRYITKEKVCQLPDSGT